MLGIGFHVREFPRIVGKGYEIGQLTENPDLVLNPVSSYLVTYRFPISLSRDDQGGTANQPRNQNEQRSALHRKPSS
jgi:hypothetical protein